MSRKRTPTSQSVDPRLGPIVQIYAGKLARRLSGLYLGGAILVSLGGVIWLLFTLGVAYQRYFFNGPATVFRTLPVPGSLALLVILLGGILLLNALQHWNLVLLQYENGFVFRNWQGDRTWFWSDIAAVQIKQTRVLWGSQAESSRHACVLTTWDKRKLLLDDRIRGVEIFANQVREKTVPLLFSRYNNAFNTGEVLQFGPVSLQRGTGIEMDGHKFGWARLREAIIHEGDFVLILADQDQKHYPSVNVSLVPNLDVLFCILDQIPGVLPEFGQGDEESESQLP